MWWLDRIVVTLHPRYRLPFIGGVVLTYCALLARASIARHGTDELDRDGMIAAVAGDLMTVPDLDTVDGLRRWLADCDDAARPQADDRARSSSHANAAGKLAERETGDCVGVVYVWSPAMPLSGTGIREIRLAARALRLHVGVLNASQLHERRVRSLAESDERSARRLADRRADSFVAVMIGAGATVHYPAVLVFRAGRLAGPAILGYKTAAAYSALIHRRLHPSFGAPPSAATDTRQPVAAVIRHQPHLVKDIPVQGRPGAYFRRLPGQSVVVFERGRVIHLLDLTTGRIGTAPGYVDFVPSPDGKLFVTPAPGRAGLEFYDAREVLEAAGKAIGGAAKPVYLDHNMRDQYPSAGVIRTEQVDGRTTTVYRVLTSWFDRVIFRDYEVRTVRGGGPVSVRPIREPTAGCSNFEISIPIIAQSGRELAGRDETSATTKIFRLADDGSCTEVVDLRLQTGKVAWDADGRRLAFAIPAGVVRDGSGLLWEGGKDNGELAGVFVFTRSDSSISRVPGSDDVDRLTFPEFAGRDSIIFLLTAGAAAGGSRFRLVCCMR